MDCRFRMIMEPHGLDAVRKIADTIWPVTFREILSPEQIAYMMNMMYAPEVMEAEFARGVYFEIIVIDGKDAGYISYEHLAECGDLVKLHKIYLLQEYHHRGYGSAMLRHVMLEARQMGAKRLRLNVNKHNEKAIAAYRRNGFTAVESVVNPIGNGFVMDDFVMERML